MTKNRGISKRENKKSKIEEFAKEEWVVIPKGVISLGIMQRKISYEENVKGQVITQNKKEGYVLVEVQSKHLLIDYDPKDLKRGKNVKY
ncbi:MAG: hypothetical protein AABW50_02110 [Nanoarchaeota archaeon]